MALVRVFFSNFPKISLCASVRPHYTEQPTVNFDVLQRGTQNNGINNGMTQFFLQINCKLCIIALSNVLDLGLLMINTYVTRADSHR